MFEGFLKKVTEGARHLMLVLYVIKRYLFLKSLSATKKEQLKNKSLVPRVVFLGGMSRPGDKLHLQLIKFINRVSAHLANDKETNKYLQMIFLPNYTTSKEYMFVPSLDVHDQLTLPGK